MIRTFSDIPRVVVRRVSTLVFPAETAWRGPGLLGEEPAEISGIVIAGEGRDPLNGKVRVSQQRLGALHPELDDELLGTNTGSALHCMPELWNRDLERGGQLGQRQRQVGPFAKCGE